MDIKYIKNYIIAGLFYILVVILLGLYQYVINGKYQFYNLWNSIGFSGVVISGIFLSSKVLRRKWVTISSWQGVVEYLGTLGIALNLAYAVISLVLLVKLIPVTVQDNDLLYGAISAVSIGLAVVLISLVTYRNGLFQTNPTGNSSANLKSWEAFGLLSAIFLITIIDRLGTWGKWFNNFKHPNNHFNVSFLPPVSIIISVYIGIVVFVYLWGLFTKHNKSGATEAPPSPVPPTPIAAPPTPAATHQNIPVHTGAHPGSVAENQSAQTQ